MQTQPIARVTMSVLDLLFEHMSLTVRHRLVCADGNFGQGRGIA